VLWTFGGTAEFGELQDAVSQVAGSSGDPDLGHAFDMALKQVEGNFVITNRYRLGGRGDKQVYVVTFQNPSIEELVERKLARDPYALASVARTVSTFRQARKVLQHVDTKNQKGLSPEVWATMRSSSADLENKLNGHLERIIGGSGNECETCWIQGAPTMAQVLHIRLAIDARAGVDDEEARILKESVLTTARWRSIIKELDTHANVAFHILQLQRWIVEASEWPDEEKSLSERGLRDVLLDVLSTQDVWIWETETVVELCKAATLRGSDLDNELCKILMSTAMRTTYASERDQDDPDSLRSDAGSLRELGELLSWPVSLMCEDLLARAQELEEQMMNDQDEDAERLPVVEATTDDFDIDALFAGLLER